MAGGRAFSARKSFAASLAEDKRRRWPWSGLPSNNPFPNITHSLESQMWVNNHRNAPATTKSRLPTTTRCNNADQRPQLVHVITANPSNPTVESDRDRPSQFLHGSIVDVPTIFASKNESYWCVLRVESTFKTTHAPPPPLSVTDPCMWFTGLGGPNIPSSGLAANYGVCGKTHRYSYMTTKYVSIRHECATIDPFDLKKKPIEFTASVVRYQGTFYAMSLQGTLVVMQMSDYRLKITGISAIRAIPSSNWRFFKEYLVEMNGEILLVFLIYEKSLVVVDRVEVFRLDLVTLGWIKVERLVGKTMFLKDRCIWVDYAEFGCMDDCVYFTQKSDDFWRVYDMKIGSISTVVN